MADNETSANGKPYATKDINSVLFPQVITTNASGTIIRGGSAYSVAVTPTISTSIYAAGDAVTPLMTFALNSVSGMIRQFVILDDDNEKAAGKIWVFRSSPTSFAANDAFAPVFADLQALVGIVPVYASDYTTVNSNAVAVIKDINLSYYAASANLYAYFVPDGTPTYTGTSDLSFRLVVLED